MKGFYINLTLDGKNLVSYVKGTKMKVTNEVWNLVAGIKYVGLKVAKEIQMGFRSLTKYSTIEAM